MYKLPYELSNRLVLMILKNEKLLRLFTWNFIDLMICGFEAVTCGFEPLTGGFEFAISGFELVTRGYELVIRGFELALQLEFQLVPLSLLL